MYYPTDHNTKIVIDDSVANEHTPHARLLAEQVIQHREDNNLPELDMIEIYQQDEPDGTPALGYKACRATLSCVACDHETIAELNETLVARADQAETEAAERRATTDITK